MKGSSTAVASDYQEDQPGTGSPSTPKVHLQLSPSNYNFPSVIALLTVTYIPERLSDMTTAAAPATSPSVGPSDTVLLPGQPIGAEYLRDPKPTVGKGCYEHKGRMLASIIGRARRDGQVSPAILPVYACGGEGTY